MPKAIFILPDQSEVELELAVGTSLMQAATANGIDSIVADCGGAASCATCHVFVESDHLERLAEPGPNEEQMLECVAAPRQAGSRLSCQIKMSEELDGIRVRIADPQF